MERVDFADEELVIAEAIGLAFHGLVLLLVPSRGPVDSASANGRLGKFHDFNDLRPLTRLTSWE
jgi:hypothetical protein